MELHGTEEEDIWKNHLLVLIFSFDWLTIKKYTISVKSIHTIHLNKFRSTKKIYFPTHSDNLYSSHHFIPLNVFRLVLSGWSSSGVLEEDGSRRGESHHPGQPWEEGRQPGPQWPPTAGEEGPVGAQWEPHWATHTPQRSPTKTPRR